MMRGPRLVHLPSTWSTPDRSPNDCDRLDAEVDEAATRPCGRGRPGSAGRSPGTTARPSASSARRSRRRTPPSCMTRSTSNSTPSRYSSSSRSLPARKITSFSGRHDAPHQRVDPRERLEVVDPDAAHGARSELGLHDRREADVGGRGEQLVERPHALGPRRRQPELGRELARADLAAGRVDGLGRVAGQPQRRGDPGGHADAVLPEREHAVGSDAGVRERVEHRLGVLGRRRRRPAPRASRARRPRRRATRTSGRARPRSRAARRARPCARRHGACPGSRR